MKKLLLIACLVLADGEAQAGDPVVQEPIEYQMAILDADGSIPSKDDPTVARFRSLLGQLSKTCGETPEVVGSQAHWASKELQKVGIEEKRLTILEGANKAIPLPLPKICNMFFAMYVINRDNGQSHDEAIETFRIAREGLENLRDKLRK